MPKLENLKLSGEVLLDTWPGLARLSGSKNLKVLDLTGMKLDDKGLAQLQNLHAPHRTRT